MTILLLEYFIMLFYVKKLILGITRNEFKEDSIRAWREGEAGEMSKEELMSALDHLSDSMWTQEK